MQIRERGASTRPIRGGSTRGRRETLSTICPAPEREPAVDTAQAREVAGRATPVSMRRADCRSTNFNDSSDWPAGPAATGAGDCRIANGGIGNCRSRVGHCYLLTELNNRFAASRTKSTSDSAAQSFHEGSATNRDQTTKLEAALETRPGTSPYADVHGFVISNFDSQYGNLNQALKVEFSSWRPKRADILVWHIFLSMNQWKSAGTVSPGCERARNTSS